LFVPRLLVERFELFIGMTESLAAEVPHRPIIGDRVEELANIAPQFLDLFARGLRVIEAIYGLRAVLELFAQIRERTLKLAQLPGKLVICGAELLRGLFGLREHRRRRRREHYRKQRGHSTAEDRVASTRTVTTGNPNA